MVPTASSLVVVTVVTRTGSQHIFPDMAHDVLDLSMRHWSKTGRAIFVNVAGAVLTIETGAVKTVSYDGEIKWTNGAPVCELPNAG